MRHTSWVTSCFPLSLSLSPSAYVFLVDHQNACAICVSICALIATTNIHLVASQLFSFSLRSHFFSSDWRDERLNKPMRIIVSSIGGRNARRRRQRKRKRRGISLLFVDYCCCCYSVSSLQYLTHYQRLLFISLIDANNDELFHTSNDYRTKKKHVLLIKQNKESIDRHRSRFLSPSLSPSPLFFLTNTRAHSFLFFCAPIRREREREGDREEEREEKTLSVYIQENVGVRHINDRCKCIVLQSTHQSDDLLFSPHFIISNHDEDSYH